MPSKRCKIHYRRLRRDNNQFPEITLQEAIDNALKRKIEGELLKENVSLRIAPVPNSADYNRFINNCFVFDKFIFGDLCLFSPGQMQALIQISADPTHPTLEEVMMALEIAESKAPDGHEYLNGISYWMVIGDHFYQIQHVSIQSKAMEEYFTGTSKNYRFPAHWVRIARSDG